MQSFLSIITAGTMMFSVNTFSRDGSVDRSSGESMTMSQRRIEARKLRANLLDAQKDIKPLTEERPKDRDTLKGQWTARWGSYSEDIKKMPMRHRVNGTILRCIQIAEKTRESPGQSCERLTDYTDLLDKCAVDMNISPYCMPVEQQVVDRAAAKSAETSDDDDEDESSLESSSSSGSDD